MMAPKESGRQATRAILFEEIEADQETMAGLVESLEQDSCALCNGLGRLSSVDWTRE